MANNDDIVYGDDDGDGDDVYGAFDGGQANIAETSLVRRM